MGEDISDERTEMIGDIFKEVQRQLVGERKGITGLPVGWGPATSSTKTDFATLSKDGYEKNALIFACINELASSASEAKCVVEKQNRKGEWEPWPQSRLQKLLDSPNPLMSAYEFWFHVILYQSLAGNCLWEKEPSRAGLTVGLWLMRPDYVSVKTMEVPIGQRTRRKIEFYKWQPPAGGSVNFPPEKIIHFKHPHPRDEIWGFPPLAAAARAGDTDNFATDFVQAFFKNAAVPFGILKIGGHVDEAMQEEAKRRLQQLYGVVSGQARWFEPMILGEGSEWVEMGKSMTDMDFPQLRRITETRICEVFQVPPILIGAFAGLERSTFANYEEARASFWMETLMPIYKKHADTLNRQLTPEFGKDMRVVWDFSGVKALQESHDAIFTRADMGIKSGWVTVNEARSMAGLEEVPGGEIFLRPMMLMPVPAEEKPQPPGAKGLQDVAHRRQFVATKSSQVPEEAKERWAKALDMVATAWESIFGKVASALFRKEKDELLKILRKEGKASTKAAPFDTFLQAGALYLLASKDGWIEEFGPLFAGLMKAQADNILGAYGISFDIDRPEVQDFLKNYTMEFAKGIEQVSEEKLRELIMKAQEEGWSVPNTRNAIMEMWDGFDKNRAQMIARTETIRSSNAGSEEAWRQAGIQKKQWYATLDGRQCPDCVELMEYTKINPITVGGNFSSGDMSLPYPPLHPNCRCTILAYFEEG